MLVPDNGTLLPFSLLPLFHYARRYVLKSPLLILFSCRFKVHIPVENLSTFLSELVTWSDSLSSTSFQQEAALHTLASIVNKHVEGISS
jgi:hypothetical protein